MQIGFGVEWDWKNIAPVLTAQSYHGEILFVHDEDDNEVPMKEVSELHSLKSNAEILITKGFGHRRILRNKDVVAKVLSFIKS